MRILKAINNNVVSAIDENGKEVIVTGKGIGFRAREQGILPTDNIEKIFRMDSKNKIDKLKELFASLPIEHINLAETVISYAKDKLDMHLNESIYLTLPDHISFAIKRQKMDAYFANPLHMEIKRFYPKEYMIGQYALELIHKNLDVQMKNDEAASIALHIVNAEYDSSSISETLNITRLIQSIIDFVKTFENFEFDENTMDYERFLTHLKFLSLRLYHPESKKRVDPEFVKAISAIYPVEFEYSQKTANYIQSKKGHILSEEEKAYLTVHLHRIQ